MADRDHAYGSAGQTITITLASLADGAARESTAISNATNLFLDVGVEVTIVTNSTGVSATGYVEVFVYASTDGGTSYSDNATGSDAAITMPSPNNFFPLGTIAANANSVTRRLSSASVKQAVGRMPKHWGIIVVNHTGAAFAASGLSAKYEGDFETVA